MSLTGFCLIAHSGASISLVAAGASGFFTLIQSGDRLER
jgi:hypothetical protein